MNCSRKKTIADYPEMNQGLPIQQVKTDGETPTEKEVMDAAREMGVEPETGDRG